MGEPTSTRVEVCPFPRGKRIALTTSFDDGQVHDRRIVRAFNEWGLKGTFNLNSSTLSRSAVRPPDDTDSHLAVTEVAELYRGHEVAAHTLTHPHLTRLDDSQIAFEVREDRKALEEIVGKPVRGFAYPFGSFDERVMGVLRTLGITYARTCVSSDQCFPPQDPLAWGPTFHQFETSPGAVERFAKFYNDDRHTGVIHLWGHGFEFHRRNDWAALERIYRPLSGKPDVWYCTNLELFDYEAARRQLVIAANRRSACNPSSLTITVLVDGKTLVEVPAGQTVPLTAVAR